MWSHHYINMSDRRFGFFLIAALGLKVSPCSLQLVSIFHLNSYCKSDPQTQDAASKRGCIVDL